MAVLLDHVIILVADLEQATNDYTSLGFHVVAGGEHDNGVTHNALVPLADGSYLELMGAKGGLNTLAELEVGPESFVHRFRQRGPLREGLIDYALLSNSLDPELAALRSRGLAFRGPYPGGRTRPDGQQMGWALAMPPTLDLPFLIADRTPRSLRVPGAEDTWHPNGVRGIAALTIGVEQVAATVASLSALAGQRVKQGGTTVVLNGTAIHVRPAPVGRAGLLSLTLRCADAAFAGLLDVSAAHGAVLALIPE